MKAVAYTSNLPIEAEGALVDVELPVPTIASCDLLIEVKAVSVNPLDAKLRGRRPPADGQPAVLGWDVSGIVTATGSAAQLFKTGDKVWYAGSIVRPGANSEYHAVDERLVGRMPASLSFAQAAALPLTAIAAWELLFDRLEVGGIKGGRREESLLVIGASGGVGSILVQLARQLTGLTVIATASRTDSSFWIKQLGAHHVLNHKQPLSEQIRSLNLPPIKYVTSLNKTDQHFDQIVDLMAPQGKLGLIDDPELIDVRKLKSKSLSLHWEMMFTRSMFQTEDMQRQHEILNKLANLVDSGVIRSTLNDHFGIINAANLQRAHARVESNSATGKIVLEGF